MLKIKKSRFTPGVRIRKIKEALAEKYGWEYIGYLETPYVIKVKVLEKNSSIFTGYKNQNLTIPKIDLKVEIQEVLKGEGFYSDGQIITVNYFPKHSLGW